MLALLLVNLLSSWSFLDYKVAWPFHVRCPPARPVTPVTPTPEQTLLHF